MKKITLLLVLCVSTLSAFPDLSNYKNSERYILNCGDVTYHTPAFHMEKSQFKSDGKIVTSYSSYNKDIGINIFVFSTGDMFDSFSVIKFENGDHIRSNDTSIIDNIWHYAFTEGDVIGRVMLSIHPDYVSCMIQSCNPEK